MVLSYKCPNCGSSMTYKEGSDHLECEHCQTTIPIKDLKETTKEETVEVAPEAHMDEAVSEDHFTGYTCENCGAQIMGDAYTAATVCSFCGSPTLIASRLSGTAKPRWVIPFAYDKTNAREKFRHWTRKGLLTPAAFRKEAVLDTISGVYVPYWLYDIHADVDMVARATRVRRRVSGNYEYIYTDHFLVSRDVAVDYERIPIDASKKMDDSMMEMLEPFDYKKLSAFDMPYLSGFQAERYNFTADQMAGRAESRASDYSLQATRNTIKGYATVVPIQERVHLKRNKAEYAMLPVWMLHCRYQGKDYPVALNGVTGKIVGKLPVSKGRAAVAFLISTVVLFAFLTLLEVLL